MLFMRSVSVSVRSKRASVPLYTHHFVAYKSSTHLINVLTIFFNYKLVDMYQHRPLHTIALYGIKYSTCDNK